MYDMWASEGQERKNAPPSPDGAEAAAAGCVRARAVRTRPQRVVQPAGGVPAQRAGEARVGGGRQGGPVGVSAGAEA